MKTTIELPDALIAATALRQEWTVVSPNQDAYSGAVPFGLRILA